MKNWESSPRSVRSFSDGFSPIWGCFVVGGKCVCVCALDRVDEFGFAEWKRAVVAK